MFIIMKHYYLSFFIATLMSMACNMASAHDIAVANSDGKTIYYNYNTDGTSVSVTYQGTSSSSYFNEYSGEIVIPETVTYGGKTYSVTCIGSGAFWGCSGLTSIDIPSSVTTIGKSVFAKCLALTSIKVQIENTKYDSREDCNAIIETASNTLVVGCKSSVIPNNVTTIGEEAFDKCEGLTSIIIPNSVTSIESEAFDNCLNLTSLSIGENVKSIGENAFNQCSALTSVSIPNSVTTIGRRAFDDCPSLTSVSIPNSVTSIGSSAFEDCSGLTSVTIPNSVTSIGDKAFYYCSGLTLVKVMRKEPPSISYSAFPSSTIIYVPYGSKAKYNVWQSFRTL